MEIRKVQQSDNPQLAQLIRGILEDMGVPKKGTAYEDTALDFMFETYQEPKSTFFVIEHIEKIIACGGIAPLNGYRDFCEFQKMYVLKDFRHQGLASNVLTRCLESAVDFGYEACYLETLPEMRIAQKLYLKKGFKYLKTPLGDTRHTACSVRMLLKF